MNEFHPSYGVVRSERASTDDGVLSVGFTDKGELVVRVGSRSVTRIMDFLEAEREK